MVSTQKYIEVPIGRSYFFCPPVRCCRMPACLHKLIYGKIECIGRPSRKHRLKAPLSTLPENTECYQENLLCSRTKRYKPKIPYACEIHCKEHYKEFKLQKWMEERGECKCSMHGRKFSVQTIEREFEVSLQNSRSYYEDDENFPSTNLIEKIDIINAVIGKKYPIESKCSCPIEASRNSPPKKEFKDNFRSYQQIINESRKQNLSGKDAIQKYLRCFDLEKETLEYIQECIRDSLKDDAALASNDDPSTNILFEKIVDEKFERINSILEISENMEDIVRMVNEKISAEKLEEDIRKRFKKILFEKLNNFNTCVIITEHVRKTIEEGDILALLESDEQLSKQPTDKLVKQLNKKLFLDKLRRIDSLVEFIAAMENAIKVNDFTAFLEDGQALTHSRNMLNKNVKNKKVNILFERTGEITNGSSNAKQRIETLEEENTNILPTNTYNKHNLNGSAKPGDSSEHQLNNDQITRTMDDSLVNDVNKDQEVVIAKNYTPTIRIDIGVDGDRVDLMKTSIQYPSLEGAIPSPNEKKNCNCKSVRYKPCPSAYFEIDSYLQSLRALITTYDPFLSPASPMRKELFLRKHYKPKRVVNIKKCFPSHTFLDISKNADGWANGGKFPISAMISGKFEAKCQQSIRKENMTSEIPKWIKNWTGRKMNNCDNVSRKKCPYGIHR